MNLHKLSILLLFLHLSL